MIEVIVIRTNVNFSSNRNDIIQKTLQLFLEKGYENTKISDILAVTGLSKGGMYHYFSSKEEILDAVIEYALDEERPLFEKQLKQSKNTFEQLSYFLSNDILSKSDFRKKLATWKKNEESLFVNYRIRELNSAFSIPYMQQIIENGVEEGIFYTLYPKEIGKQLYLIGENIFLQLSDYDTLRKNENQIKKEYESFINIMTKTLEIDEINKTIIYGAFIQELYRQIEGVLKKNESITV